MSESETTNDSNNLKPSSSSSITRRKHGSNCTANLLLEQSEPWQQESSALLTTGPKDSDNKCSLAHTTGDQSRHSDCSHVTGGRDKARQYSSSDASEMRLMTYADLPGWMQDNDYIKCGYRPQMPSFASCLKSVCGIHTETGNIWTHLVGCSLFVVLAPYTFYMHQEKLSHTDLIIFSVYFSSIIMCLAFSTIYHIFTCHSEDVARFCKRIDYCGISILITGSIISWTYYAFYHDPTSRTIYLTIVTIIGFLVAVVSLLKKFGDSEFRSIRTTIYIIYGVSAALPVIHYFFSHNYVEVPLVPLFSFGALYILGGVLYANRIPEKYCPGRFDIVCHSHQLFHILVVLAAWIHLFNIRYIALKRIEGTMSLVSK